MYGANPDRVELRPSEIKGLMRWWWRAMVASDQIEELRKNEAKIFGGSGENEGKSKFRLQLSEPNIFQKSQNSSFSIQNQFRGIQYLFYSILMDKKNKTFLAPGCTFDIEISAYKEEYVGIAAASLWLAIYLGGFGTRSRRGGGNLEVIEVKGSSPVEFKVQANNPRELKDFINSNIEKIKRIFPVGKGTKRYTTLKQAKIYIFKAERDYEKALNFLGERFRDFRVKNKSRIFETAAFGMPIMHRSTKDKIIPFLKDGTPLNRWASPLIFKVICSKGNYFPVIVKLSPGGVDIVGKEQTKDPMPFNSRIIEEFLKTFEGSEKFEVIEL